MFNIEGTLKHRKFSTKLSISITTLTQNRRFSGFIQNV